MAYYCFCQYYTQKTAIWHHQPCAFYTKLYFSHCSLVQLSLGPSYWGCIYVLLTTGWYALSSQHFSEILNSRPEERFQKHQMPKHNVRHSKEDSWQSWSKQVWNLKIYKLKGPISLKRCIEAKCIEANLECVNCNCH